MKYYGLYIKSHTFAPDYEDEGYFNSLDDAIKAFANKAHWTEDEIREYVHELDVPNLDREEDM